MLLALQKGFKGFLGVCETHGFAGAWSRQQRQHID